MKRPFSVAAALVLGLVACEEAAGPWRSGTGGLVLEIVLTAPGGATHLDSGHVRVTGPTSRTVKAVPGNPVTIGGLLPGTYTVELEGFDGGDLAYFGQVGNVNVVAGQTTPVSGVPFVPLHLAFKVQTSDVRAGRVMTPAVEVSVVNPTGGTITSATNRVTIAIGTNPSGASLSGTKTVAAVNGVATFNNLTMSETGSGYELAATSGALDTARSAPLDVTFDLAVANANSGTVSRIETAYNAVVAHVPVGSAPSRYVAFTPDAQRLFVTSQTAPGNVWVLDAADNTIVAVVAVGDGAQGIAITPDGAVAIVANSFANTVSVISTLNNTVVATEPVGQWPMQVAITPDGARAYVTHDISTDVWVIDPRTGAVVGVVPVGSPTRGVAISPNGSLAYVTHSSGNTVSRINTSTLDVVGTVIVDGGPAGIGLTPSGAYLYVANQSGAVSVVETVTHTVATTIPVGGQPWGLAVSPGGQFVYVSDLAVGRVVVIATATNTVVANIPVQAGPQGLALPAR